MNFLELAMDIEDEGIRYYMHLSAKTIDKESATIFQYLAKEEQRHYDIFNAWQKKIEAPPIEDTGIFGIDAPTVFKRLMDHFETFGVPAVHYHDAYEKALLFEKKSIAAYTDALTKLDEREQKVMLTKIITQEKSHARFITHMLEFLRHPGEWLENAEWVHHEEF